MDPVKRRPRFNVVVPSRMSQAERWDGLRNPSLVWRRLIVGVVLALPGMLIGQLIALVSPAWATTLLAALGAVLGFFSGFCME